MAVSLRHKRFYPKKSDRVSIQKFNTKSGMIVEFPYKNKKGESSRPLVFVMDTNEFKSGDKRTFSGINLNHLPSFEIEKFFVRILAETGWDIDRHTKIAKVDLWEEEDPGVRPIIIYNHIVKPVILPRYNCWRTFKYNNIQDIYQIRFHFTTKPLNLVYEGDVKLGTIKKSEMNRILRNVNILSEQVEVDRIDIKKS